MKRVYLQKITQYGSISYIGKIDPRELIKVAKKVEMSTTQDAQRPLNEKRVKSIAKYVSEENALDSAGFEIGRKMLKPEMRQLTNKAVKLLFYDLGDIVSLEIARKIAAK